MSRTTSLQIGSRAPHPAWQTGLAIALAAVLPTSAAEGLRLTQIELLPGEGLRLQFGDDGSPATGYVVETVAEFAPDATWSAVAEATLRTLGDGTYEARLPTRPPSSSFYRIRALTASGPVQVRFGAATVRTDEGAGTVEIPLLFSAAYEGIVRYRVGGTAGPEHVGPLTGEVAVAGSSAVIRVALEDNALIERFRFLTLALEVGPDLVPVEPFETTVEIVDNDAAWRGTFASDGGSFGFVFEKLASTNGLEGVLRGGPGGVLPRTGWPATVQQTATTFSATATGIPMSPDDSFLDSPAEVALQLEADADREGEVVTADLLRGRATFTVMIPGKPHLASTNAGSFVLVRPPALPATNEVQLVSQP